MRSRFPRQPFNFSLTTLLKFLFLEREWALCRKNIAYHSAPVGAKENIPFSFLIKDIFFHVNHIPVANKSTHQILAGIGNPYGDYDS